MLVFITCFTVGIYYLCTLLVFTTFVGIYYLCWYLLPLVVFTTFGIYYRHVGISLLPILFPYLMGYNNSLLNSIWLRGLCVAKWSRVARMCQLNPNRRKTDWDPHEPQPSEYYPITRKRCMRAQRAQLATTWWPEEGIWSLEKLDYIRDRNCNPILADP